jgi:hypothetical protein
LIASPGYATRHFDAVSSTGNYQVGPFSAGGELFVYSKAVGDGYYIDLRQGVVKAPEPIAIPGAIGSREFASSGTDFVYVRGFENCFYIDFSGAAAADPVKVNDAGTVSSCSFQKLPR